MNKLEQDLTFHVRALDAAQDVFDGKDFADTNEHSAACDALTATLRKSDEFATVQMSHDPTHGSFTVMIDRAPQSVAGFEGQDERLYVTYKMTEGEPLKFHGSRKE